MIPTSWLEFNQLIPDGETPIKPLSDAAVKILKQFELQLVDLLLCVLRYGQVIIVTSAEATWVTQSARLLFPTCAALIAAEIKIVSARDSCSKKIPSCSTCWKINVFSQELMIYFEANKDTLDQVISFGDGEAERLAMHAISPPICGTTICKHIKLIEEPSIEELMIQLERLKTSLPVIYHTNQHLDWKIKLEKDGNCVFQVNSTRTSSHHPVTRVA